MTKQEFIQKLREAQAAGVPQITGPFCDDKGGKCAQGVGLLSIPGIEIPPHQEETVFEDGVRVEPYEVCKMLGLNRDEQNKVAVLNDIDGKSFGEIADYLEQNP